MVAIVRQATLRSIPGVDALDSLVETVMGLVDA